MTSPISARWSEQWDAANLHGDAAALDKVLASDFFLTGDDGKVHAKAEVISELKSPQHHVSIR